MFNTIILLRGSESLTNNEYKRFEKGDTIFSSSADPEEIKRWSIEQKEEAKKELAKYECTYSRYNEYLINIEEYALEYCECDYEGEFVEGCDIELAKEIEYFDKE